AVMAETIKVNINEAVGKIAGEIACPCPPGVPVIMPGEKISDYEQEVLRKYGISKINVLK
ncbi:MAG: amino acid decarboxylase, partial [Clostridia bacterium]|nr:amino acid decarboxylase [Clostridia bacterium]